MSLNPDECEFKQEGLCCHTEHPYEFRGSGWECNATESDVMTEEEYEEGLKAMRAIIKAHAGPRMGP